MALVFNKKQQLAVEKINEFISQDDEKLFYLMGYAGTGKTYLLGKIIKDLLLTNKMEYIFVCAPTHKALKVIESYLRSNLTQADQTNFLPKLSFMTIHKLLDFKPIIMAEDGSKIFKSTKESKFLKQMEDKLIVIDECSMISKEMIIELKKYTKLYPIKVIFMGDRKQLPPVGEAESLIFTNIPKNYHYHILLDQIMRTNSSDIKEVCTIIRSWNKKDSLCKLLLPVHNRKVPIKTFKLYHKKADYLESTWFKNFIKNLEAGNIPIILTWKNTTSDRYNAMVRKYVHKSANLNNYMAGDYAMFNNYYTSPDDNTSFYTSDMIKIIDVVTEDKILFDWTKIIVPDPKTIIDKALNNMLKKISNQKNNFNVDTFTVEKIHSDVSSVIHGKTHMVQTIHRDDLTDYNSMLTNVQEHIEFFFKKYKAEQLTSKLWDIFHKKLIDPYSELNFGYSITVYKSQGSTFHTVMVDMDDINEIREVDDLQKALYTAAGRASQELGFLL